MVGHHGFTNAALDIVFIDLLRRWEYVNSDRAAGEFFNYYNNK